jgi:hypothetical protein|tara:strand:+ start:1273 stop:1611 length:339 start_codon:yes stop_codon:yes gene_type:complete
MVRGHGGGHWVHADAHRTTDGFADRSPHRFADRITNSVAVGVSHKFADRTANTVTHRDADGASVIPSAYQIADRRPDGHASLFGEQYNGHFVAVWLWWVGLFRYWVYSSHSR